MILNYKTIGNGYAPVRQHKEDAGFDLHTPVDFGIHGQSYKFLVLEVCVEIPKGYVGLILGRSSRSKNGVIVLSGVIDAGYTGQLGVTFFNANSNAVKFNAGERIAQLVICKIADVEDTKEQEKLDSNSERGNNGFGSTGV